MSTNFELFQGAFQNGEFRELTIDESEKYNFSNEEADKHLNDTVSLVETSDPKISQLDLSYLKISVCWYKELGVGGLEFQYAYDGGIEQYLLPKQKDIAEAFLKYQSLIESQLHVIALENSNL